MILNFYGVCIELWYHPPANSGCFIRCVEVWMSKFYLVFYFFEILKLTFYNHQHQPFLRILQFYSKRIIP